MPHNDLTTEQIQSVLQGISIPPQPQIMVDLQMEQIDPNCSIGNIAKLIQQDVGLAGSILKTVNSPFFGLSNEITSIQQAVNLLGINSVVNLVNALSIRGELSDEQIVALGRFWDSAMEIAMASATIAKQIGFASPDEAYSLGLFHNCGIPLLMMKFDNYLDVMQQSYNAATEREITTTENILLKTNHAVVGYYVAKSWNLPTHICQAIHEHHNIEKVFAEEGQGDKKTLLATLKMAEHICGNYRTLGCQSIDEEWQRIEETILIYVGLSQYDFSGLKEQVYDLGLGQGGYMG